MRRMREKVTGKIRREEEIWREKERGRGRKKGKYMERRDGAFRKQNALRGSGNGKEVGTGRRKKNAYMKKGLVKWKSGEKNGGKGKFVLKKWEVGVERKLGGEGRGGREGGEGIMERGGEGGS